ncbi:MAG: DUF4878 domain-containing protein [Candidatus Aminicenantes bacterium]|nr:DUF4878 domain-containing protein [Candidatus Aminicenantes bacterium]
MKAAYTAANEGRYSEAEKYLHSEALNYIKTGWGVLWLKRLWDKMSKNGNIEKIEIIKEKIRGEGASVDFKKHFKDGETKNISVPLFKEDGFWKIAYGSQTLYNIVQPLFYKIGVTKEL